MKKVKFFTLGCKVNQYETQAMREELSSAGFTESNNESADIYIVNTCTVTAHADRESRQIIRRCLQSNPDSQVVVTGCYVERDAQEILQISPRIQIVPNQQKHQIINFLNFTNDERQTTNDEIFIPLQISDFCGHERAFVKIQDGCNNFCSFCKVPYVRGSSRSRGLPEIIAEAERLINRGFKEIVLTGICLGDYHYKDIDLADVIASLQKPEGEFRLRLSSIEPQHINDKLIEAFNSPKVCAHLHIPLQSGDDKILKKMNRRYTVKDYLSLIDKIKKRIKDVGVTTDVLVGFPGEEKKNFDNTVRCLKEILPLRTHIFSFSPRQETRAFEFPDRIEPWILKERANLLKEVAQECSYNFRKRFLGKSLTVLLESQPDRKSGKLCGYSENYIRVVVEDAPREDINKLLPVRVEDVDRHTTRAQRKWT